MSKCSTLSFGDYGLLNEIVSGNDSIIIPGGHMLSREKYVEVHKEGIRFKSIPTQKGIKEMTKERQPFTFRSSKLDSNDCPRWGEPKPVSITIGEMK